MSDQEKSGGSGSMVVVEKTESSQHKPYRPTELQEETASDLHKRSKAPAVPTVAEELKDTAVTETTDIERQEIDHAISTEKHTHVPKKLSSNKRRGKSPPEEIAMVLMDARKDLPSIHPIPARVDTVASDASSLKSAGKADKADNDSITDEVAELRTEETAKGHSEWSDDEEASGLPRSESRASRVSRAMRQLLCCGVAYRAPSEEDIPPREYSGI